MSNAEKIIPSLIGYRNHLKALKAEVSKKFSKLRKKIDPISMEKACDLINEKGDQVQSFDAHKLSQMVLSYYTLDIRGKKSFAEITDAYIICDIFITNLENYIKQMNDLMEVIKHDGLSFVLEISNNIIILNELWLHYNGQIRALSEIIGITIKRTIEAMDNNDDNKFDFEYPLELRILGKYFKADGTFVIFDEQNDCLDFDEYIEVFRNTLSKIKFINHDRCLIFSEEEFKEASDFTSLFAALTELLKSDCLNYRTQKVLDARKDLLITLKKLLALKEGPKEPVFLQEEVKDKTIQPEIIDSKEALENLQRYYENGFIIAIPNDINEFSKYLNACDISLEEKSFIWNTLLSIMNDEIIPSLEGSNLRRYLKVLQVLRNVNFNSDLYFRLSDERSALLEANTLLKEASDEQDVAIIRESQTEAIDKLESIINGYLKDYPSGNNVIFLTGENAKTYIESDISLHPELESDFYNLTLGLMSGDIILERIDDVKDTNLPMYVASANQANLYLVEIVLGIYMIIGISPKTEKKKNMQNRAFKNKDVLEQYQENMFNYFQKNKALILGSETYQRIRERNR